MSSSSSKIELIAVDANGQLMECDKPLSEFCARICESYGPFYEKVGFELPWVGYFAREKDQWVGSCGFKGPPINGRVEIAYVTSPEHREQGVATRMAAELLEIAKRSDSSIKIWAETMPEESASTSILKKFDFERTSIAQDEEVGEVWVWERVSTIEGADPRD